MSDRWVSLNDLAAETGLVTRTLQYIRTQEPGVLVYRTRGKVTEYQQPACAINLRKREVDKAVREAGPADDLDSARTRKALAEAELVELEVAKARGAVVALADYERALASILDLETARLRALPVRMAHFGPEVEAVAEQEVERIVQEMAAFDQDVIEETPPEQEQAA